MWLHYVQRQKKQSGLVFDFGKTFVVLDLLAVFRTEENIWAFLDYCSLFILQQYSFTTNRCNWKASSGKLCLNNYYYVNVVVGKVLIIYC